MVVDLHVEEGERVDWWTVNKEPAAPTTNSQRPWTFTTARTHKNRTQSSHTNKNLQLLRIPPSSSNNTRTTTKNKTHKNPKNSFTLVTTTVQIMKK
jgi:hypothetical protein